MIGRASTRCIALGNSRVVVRWQQKISKMSFTTSISQFSTVEKHDYPCDSLLPKRETGVLSFLSKYPEYDGRGVIIAIFDSGVDPGAPGLQVTPDGEPKVIERYDCSGSGDVDTSVVVKADANKEIKTATGRMLKIPSSWENPSGDFFIGSKPLYEIYTSKVKERVEKRRKEQDWDPQHRVILAETTKKLQIHQTSISNKSADNISKTEKWLKEDIESQIDMLNVIDKKYKDLGQMVDCVVFHNGKYWQACLCLPNQDFNSALVLNEFKVKQDYGHILNEDQVSLSINVWDEGKKLEIVGMSGSHGTHVACIAAGYFPENNDLNGVAPGAKIISYSIGDSRLDSMETGTSLVRAMCHVMQNSDRIHVINMSYGEHAHWSSSGRIGELMKELVDKHNVVWVSSAGNHGPALSTVGSPPWIASNTIIGVGAFVTPDMMTAEYSLRDKLPGMPYSWSSRGPTPDGDLGVSVCAPGGAITSVPKYTLRNAQLMNGTSMASPHVAGCIALLLSGAMQKGFKWSPYSIKKAIEISAQSLPDIEITAQGNGLIEMEPAFGSLEMLSEKKERDIRFNISVGSGSGSGTGWPMKGIYIRDPPVDKPKEYLVTIDPVFFKDDSTDPEHKFNFRMPLILTSDVSWVQVPKFVDLANFQRVFSVKTDPEGLDHGVHYGRVVALDSSDVKKGPVFSFLVTIIKPIQLQNSVYHRPVWDVAQLKLKPGQIQRYFFQVPKGATWATLNVKLKASNGSAQPSSSLGTAKFVIHVMTLHPLQSCKSEEYYRILNLQPLEESTIAFKASEGRVLELCVGRWWAEPSEVAELGLSLTFRSININRPEILLNGGEPCQKVVVTNGFATEEVYPVASIKHQVTLLRPSDMKIIPLSQPRDLIPNGRVIYELQSTYSFNLQKNAEIFINCSLLSDTLYEAEYESQLWMLFDCNKRHLFTGDAYPNKWNTKLEKGEYTVRLQVRHEKKEALEKFMNLTPNNGNSGTIPSSSLTFTSDSHIPTLPLLLSAKLPSNISLDVYQNQYDVQDYKSSKKSSGWSAILKRDSSVNVYVSSIIGDKNLKNLPCTSTLYLQGTFTASKDENGKKICSYPVKLFLPDPPPRVKNTSSKDSEKPKGKLEEMMEQLRDQQINWIGKLEEEDSLDLYKKLCEDHESHIPLHVARLQYLDGKLQKLSFIRSPSKSNSNEENVKKAEEDCNNSADSKEKLNAKFNDILEIGNVMLEFCDKILSMIDVSNILEYLGNRSPNSLPEPVKTKQSMEKQKSAALEALAKKGLVYAEFYNLKQNHGFSTSTPVDLESLDRVLAEIQKLADLHDSKVAEYTLQHAMARKFYGTALKAALKQVESEGSKWNVENDKKISRIFDALKWHHCKTLWDRNSQVKYFKDFRPF